MLAEFSAAELERLYCDSRLASELQRTRTTILGLAIILAGLTALDISSLLGSQAFTRVFALKALLIAVSAVGLLWLGKGVSRRRMEYTYLTVWSTVSVGLSLGLWYDVHWLHKSEQVFYFALAAFVAFVPCRLRVGIVAALVSAAGAFVVNTALLSTDDLVHAVTVVSVAVGGGYTIALSNERMWRRSYLTERQLDEERKNVEETARTLREQLLLTQKSRALSVLNAGIIHDFNNMLMAVRANALGVRDALAVGGGLDLDGAREASLDILEAVDSASDLSKRLLAFGKPDRSDHRDVTLDQALGRVLKVLQRLVPDRIVLDVNLGADEWKVEVLPGHLEQIISNLVVNAIEALPSAGKVCVSTRYDPEQERVMLKVSDDGIGMDEQQLTRIFDPFYTTKVTGNGLGLPTVKSVVEESGGEVRLESQLGSGTSVTVLLPVVVVSERTHIRPGVSGFVAREGKRYTA